MEALSRVNYKSSITIIFIATILLTWITNVGSLDGIYDDIFFEILHPVDLSYTYRLRPTYDFGTSFNASFPGKNITLVPVEPETGCRKPDNAEKLVGGVAFVWRGDCTFFEKSVIAEEAGAIAIIIADYYTKSIEEERVSPQWMDYQYIDMTIDKDVNHEREVNIPAGFLLGKNGRMIRDTLRRLKEPHALINIPVNLTFAAYTDINQPPWVAL